MKKKIEPSFYEECVPFSSSKMNKEYRQSNYLFENEKVDNALDYKEFFECKFIKVTFTNHIRRAMFTDVIFENCDFSNIDMRECVFRRVIFRKCRMTGVDLTQGTFEDVCIESSQGQYANFNSSKMKDCVLKDNVLVESGFSMCKLNELEIDSCDFSRAEFYDTRLKGLDFSTSEISGIILDINTLKGIIVNEEQAIACAKLLGIIVK